MSTWNSRANEVFLEALELPAPGRRQEFLDGACRGDAALRADVEALLAAGDQAGSFLESPVVSPALMVTLERPNAERLGETIGSYKLLEQIGEGGFGVVFMAEQQQPIRRKVALKVLKPGMDTRQIVARFEAERQALALMDHPNIAQVFDGGTTPAGRPYFVMELVRGVPITEFCDQSRLNIRQRLALFADVCQSVQHAHQKGIIHRDIKPTNVMVTLHDDTPVVKTIDFGIAKAMGRQLTEKTLFTNYAQMIGTPLYMSPEQAQMSGLDIDTRSDIYSLGVLLYELLTGTTPFASERLSKAGYDEMRRIIREEEPPKPSTRMSTVGEASATASEKRQADPRKLNRLFRGELDWIVMKALEKDRNRRYETANALAQDVRRYLADEPVLACPPSAWYRVGKFARRNKTALAMAACILFALAAITGGGGWLVRDRLARRWDSEAKAVEALESMEPRLRDVQPKDAALAAAVMRVQALLEGGALGPAVKPRAEQFLRDVRMLVELDEIRLRAAESRGGEMWNWSAAEKQYTAAFKGYGLDVTAIAPEEAASQIRDSAIAEALLAGMDSWMQIESVQEPARDRLRAVADRADANTWRKNLRGAAVAVDKTKLRAIAGEASVLTQPPSVLDWLGALLVRAGLLQEAETILRQAQQRHPEDFWGNYHLGHFLIFTAQPSRAEEAVGYFRAAVCLRPTSAEARSILGLALTLKGDPDAAITALRQAITLDAKFAPARINLGDAMWHKGQLDQALAAYREAVDVAPDNRDGRIRLADTLKDKGQHDEAITEYRETLRRHQDFGQARDNLANLLHERAAAHGKSGRHDRAIDDLSEAIELDPGNAEAWQSRSREWMEMGQYDQAQADAAKAIEILRRRGELETETKNTSSRMELGHGLWHMARVLSVTKNHTHAEASLREALDVFDRLAASHRQERFYRQESAFTLRFLSDELRAAGLDNEAVDRRRRAADLYAGLIAEEPHFSFYRMELAFTYTELGWLYRDTKRANEAEEAFQKAQHIARKLLGETPLEQSAPGVFINACRGLVEILFNTDRAQEAKQLCRQVAPEWRSALARNKETVTPRIASRSSWELALALEGYAQLTNQLDEASEAETCYREAHAIWRELVAEFNREDHRKHLAWTNQALGDLAAAAGRLDDAAEDYRQAAEVWGNLAADFPRNSSYGNEFSGRLVVLAKLYAQQGRPKHMAETLAAGVEKSPNAAAAMRVRGEMFARWTLLPEAAADYASAFQSRQPAESFSFMHHALLRLVVMDDAGYRDVCQRMLAKFAESPDAETWLHVAVALSYHSEPAVEPSQIAAYAERAFANGKTAWRAAYLGLAYLRAKQFERAAAPLDESLMIDAQWNPPVVYSLLAMARHHLGDGENALAALATAGAAHEARFQAMLDNDVGYWPGHWWDVLHGVLLYTEACALIHGSPPSDDARLLVVRGRALRAVGRADEARGEFDRAFAMKPQDLHVRLRALPDPTLAEAYRPAFAALRTFFQEHPRQSPAAVLAMAHAQQHWGGAEHAAGRLSAAAEALLDAAASYEKLLAQIAEAPKSRTDLGVPTAADNIAWYRHELGYVLTYAGHVLRRLGRLPEAETALKRGEEAHALLTSDARAPANTKSRLAWTQTELGMVLEARGACREAEQQYRAAIALLQEQAKADYWLGESYEALAQLCDAQGRAAEALEAWRQAAAACEQLAIEPTQSPDGRARSYQRQAALLLRTKDHAAAPAAQARAIAAYVQAIEAAPGSAEAHNNLAWMYATCPVAELRDPAKAVALAKKALELKPTDGTVLNTLGVAHYRAGDWPAAVEALTKAMELRDGGDAFDWFFLAMAHWRLGDKEQARKWYGQASGRMEKKQPSDDELARFRAEADELLATSVPP